MKRESADSPGAFAPAAEIASGFSVEAYRELRPGLDPSMPDTPEWAKAIDILRRRLEERFLRPIDHLARLRRRRDGVVPGFAMLALDCLVIDTLQSFREGRVATGEGSAARSFREFLNSPRFADFDADDRADFFNYIRNGLLHNGETRGDWRVSASTHSMLSRVGRTRVIHRTRFHEAVREECREYFEGLSSGEAELRENFRRRMDAICGFEVAQNHFYFAYGSNLAAAEIQKTAPGASPAGIAFLPGFRLVFTKHSLKWGGDAATLEECAASVVWGFVYQVTPEERAALVAREAGYSEQPLTVWGVDERCRFRDGRPIAALTFVAKEVCPDRCGPVSAYRDLVIEGANSRGLPASYVEGVARAPVGAPVSR